MTSSARNIVFIDGECVLCGNLVKLLLRIDKKEKLKFASLQSSFSRSMLPSEFVEDSNYKSVAFLTNGEFYYYSEAVIKIFTKLGFPWSLFRLGHAVPKRWRDSLYMKVSSNRYSWFGKSDRCIIPDERVRKRYVHEI